MMSSPITRAGIALWVGVIAVALTACAASSAPSTEMSTTTSISVADEDCPAGVLDGLIPADARAAGLGLVEVPRAVIAAALDIAPNEALAGGCFLQMTTISTFNGVTSAPTPDGPYFGMIAQGQLGQERFTTLLKASGWKEMQAPGPSDLAYYSKTGGYPLVTVASPTALSGDTGADLWGLIGKAIPPGSAFGVQIDSGS